MHDAIFIIELIRGCCRRRRRHCSRVCYLCRVSSTVDTFVPMFIYKNALIASQFLASRFLHLFLFHWNNGYSTTHFTLKMLCANGVDEIHFIRLFVWKGSVARCIDAIKIDFCIRRCICTATEELAEHVMQTILCWQPLGILENEIGFCFDWNINWVLIHRWNWI